MSALIFFRHGNADALKLDCKPTKVKFYEYGAFNASVSC